MGRRFAILLLALFSIGQAAADLESIRALRIAGDYTGAIESAQAELELQSNDSRLLNELGELLLETGALDEATANFEQAMAQAEPGEPEHLLAQLNRAEVHRLRGERTEAEVLWQDLTRAYQSAPSLSARDLYAIASATRHLGRSDPQLFKDAVRLYEQARDKDPAYLEAGIALGELLLEKYNNTEASAVFEELLEIDDRHPGVLLGLARSLHFDYSSDAAEAAQLALSINPNLVPAHVFMARIFIELERYDDARREVQHALDVNPVSLEALTLVAVVDHLERKTEDFAAIEQKVLALNPLYADFYVTLAELASRNRLYRDAERFARRAVELDDESWRGHGELGLNRLRLGEMDTGQASLERSFGGDPYNVWIRNTLQLTDSFENYVQTDSGRFSVVLHGDENALLGEYIHDLAARAYEEMSQRYQHHPDFLVRVELFPDHADFSVRTVGLAGVGLLGVAFGPVVAMDSPAARQRGSFNWGSTLWHELAHVFHLSMSENRVPRWFSEGLAVYEERRGRPGWGSDVTPDFLLAYLEGRLLPVSRLNEGFVRPSYPEQIAHSYFQASLVFEFIEQRWGFDVVRNSLNAYRDSFNPEGVLLEQLQIDSDTLDADFDEYLRARYATPLAALGLTAEDGGSSTTKRPPATEETALPDHYQDQIWVGQLLFEQGNDAVAEEFLLRAQELFPEYAGGDSSYWLLALLYLRQERWELAQTQLERLVSINAEHYHAQLELAKVRAKLGDHAGAAAALENAVYIYPYEAQLYQEMVGYHETLTNWDDVARARRALLALDPVDRAEAYYQLALAYHNGGNRSSAREQILYALEIAPNFRRAQDLLLALRAESPDTGEAQ